jgi:TolC family type I secretion outer membrane protein
MSMSLDGTAVIDGVTGRHAAVTAALGPATPRRPKPPARRGLARALVAGLALAAVAAHPAGAQTLEEALVAAYSSNPNLLSAQARLRTVNEGVPQALSNWRPRVTVTGSAGFARSESEGGFGSGTEKTEPREIGAGVTQPLYRGGRTIAATARAEAEVEAERARLTATEQQVLLDAVVAYMDVWRDQSVLRLNQSNEQVLRRQLEAARDRFTVGEITRTDVAQSESRLAGATAERIAAAGELASSRAVFQQVIGIYPGVLTQPPALEGLPVERQAVVEVALARNPNLISAQFSARAARHQVREDLGRFLPEVSLVGDIGHSEESAGEDSESDRYQILAQVSIPLYQQGLVSSQVRAGKQTANQRRLEIDSARRTVQQNAIRAWEALETARAQIASFSAQVAATQIALEGVRQENAVGARTVLDLLDAEQELLDAQVNLVRAQRDVLVAGYAEVATMGRLTAADQKLPVDIYDPVGDYEAVRNKWFGAGIPGD